MATDELLQFEDAEEDPLLVVQDTSQKPSLLSSRVGDAVSLPDRTTVSHKRPREEDDDEEVETTKIIAAVASTNTSSSIPVTTTTAPPNPRLSKWAARLLDPHRPRGLVEPPAVIPLNDEVLQAFGRRERAADQARGITLEIDRSIVDDDDDDDPQSLVITPKTTTTTTTTDGGTRKVKISNIKYTVTANELEALCSQFGVIESCYLPASSENAALNQGFAYILFEQSDAALACIVNVTGARPEASPFHNKRNTNSSSHKKSSAPRYWEATQERQQQKTDARLLSTKCYRCGETGHMAFDCASTTPMVKPCPLCASLEHSELRQCPARQICFQCGLPGHVSRACSTGSRRRMLCTVCFQSTHRKHQCNRSAAAALRPPSVAAAVCLTCGNTGHFLCRPLQWFFGLEGVSCSNWCVR